jgi:hypothetical protein
MNRKQRTGHFVQHALIHQRLRKIQMRLRDSMTLTWEGVGFVPAQSSFCAMLSSDALRVYVSVYANMWVQRKWSVLWGAAPQGWNT